MTQEFEFGSPMRIDTIYDNIWERKVREQDTGLVVGSRAAVALGVLPPGRKLLDVGCGDGAFLQRAQERYSSVVGVDVSGGALRRAVGRNLAVLRSDINTDPLPFPSESFDAVVSLDVIEHVLDPTIFLREISRVVRPGGWLIVSTPNVRYVKHVVTLVVGGRFPRTSGDSIGFDGGHLHYFTAKDLRELVLEAGCEHAGTVGIVPNRRLAFLRVIAHIRPVYEWLAAGLIVRARKVSQKDSELAGAGESGSTDP